MAAAILWLIALIDAIGTGGRGRLSGLPLGADFVAFYAFAHIGLTGQFDLLSSTGTFFATQVSLVPSSADTVHPPLYPPQLAILLAPMALLQYGHALAVLSAFSIVGHVWITDRLARSCERLVELRAHVAVLSLASPALWLLVLHGQLSVLALVAVYAAWEAHRRRLRSVAGLALGLLAYKVTLFAPVLALLALAGEGRLLLGAAAGAMVQYAVAVPWVGLSGIAQYARTMQELALEPASVAAKPMLMHSLRTFWSSLLSPGLAVGAYALSALAVLAIGARAWRASSSALDQIALVTITAVLVSPHLYVYDLIILAPMMVAAFTRALADDTNGLRAWTWACYTAPAWGIPVAALGITGSTVALAGWFFVYTRHLTSGRGGSTGETTLA